MGKGLRVSIKNDRIVTVEQAILKLEALTNEKIANLRGEMAETKADIKSLKDNEIHSLGEEIGKVKDDLGKRFESMMGEIVKLKLWQAKLMGGIALAWIVIQVALKIWK